MSSKDISIKSGKPEGFDTDKTLRELEVLYSFYHHSSIGIAETYRRIATALREANPKVTWTWSYLHMVSRKVIEPSPKLMYGISNLYLSTINDNYEHLEKVQVLAPMGLVEPNTLVKQGSRRCKRCNRPFLPNVSNQVYCSFDCRRNRGRV